MKTAWPLVDPNDGGIRSAGNPDECFYCNQKIGQPHSPDCVVVTKTVRFRVMLDVDITVPHIWSPEEIRRYQLEQGHHEVLSVIFEGDGERDYLQDIHCEFVGIVDETPQRALQKEASK